MILKSFHAAIAIKFYHLKCWGFLNAGLDFGCILNPACKFTFMQLPVFLLVPFWRQAKLGFPTRPRLKFGVGWAPVYELELLLKGAAES